MEELFDSAFFLLAEDQMQIEERPRGGRLHLTPFTETFVLPKAPARASILIRGPVKARDLSLYFLKLSEAFRRIALKLANDDRASTEIWYCFGDEEELNIFYTKTKLN